MCIMTSNLYSLSRDNILYYATFSNKEKHTLEELQFDIIRDICIVAINSIYKQYYIRSNLLFIGNSNMLYNDMYF